MIDLEKISENIIDETHSVKGDIPSLRPILFIGLGGFGCSIIRNLKKKILRLAPDHKDGFAFLGLDTHPTPANDNLGRLEYVPLSLGVCPDTVARQNPQLDWYKKIVGEWKARNINTGADKVRAVGRLAFRHPPTFSDFMNKLNGAINKINRFRKNFNIEEIPKVYIISTLAGGTGSGCLVDVMASVSYYLKRHFGANYLMQSIVATPEALQGEAPAIDFPEFYANTYGTLKEINHFISGGKSLIQFDDAQYRGVEIDQTSMPDPIFLVTDKNESRKSIVDNIGELAEMLTSYLLFEIRTPIKEDSGQPKPQDRENPNFDLHGTHGTLRAISSLGVVQVGLPFEEVRDLISGYLVSNLITSELISEDVAVEADDWINTASLAEAGSDQLQKEIRKEKDGKDMRISLDVEGALKGVKNTERVTVCRQLSAAKIKSLEEQKVPVIEVNEKRVVKSAQELLESKVDRICQEKNVGTVVSFIRVVKDKLAFHKAELDKELGQGKTNLTKIEKECAKEIETIGRVAKSGIIGRKGRTEAAISSFGGHLVALLNIQVDVISMEKGIRIYDRLIAVCNSLLHHWEPVIEVLKARDAILLQKNTNLGNEINRMANVSQRGPGNRFSLVDFNKVIKIYKDLVRPIEGGILQQMRRIWIKNNFLVNADAKHDAWIGLALQEIYKHVQTTLDGLNFNRILDMFYPSEQDKRDLFVYLSALASPLFPIDPDRKEEQYSTYWIIATHPEMKRKVVDEYATAYLTGEGRMFAPFNNPYEIIIYSIKHGYTLYSLSSVDDYYLQYSRLQDRYERSQKRGPAARAIHSWEDAHLWEEINPIKDGRASFRSFVLGWAFSMLFPSQVSEDGSPDEKRNKAFIYHRGANFYLLPPSRGRGKEPKEEKIGQGLEDALKTYYEHHDWIKHIDDQVEQKIDEVGTSEIKIKMESFDRIIDEKIEAAKKGRDFQRERALLDLKGALKEAMGKMSAV